MIRIGGREVKEAWLGGVELAEIWLGGRLVWSGKYIRAKISAVLTLDGQCVLVTAEAVPAAISALLGVSATAAAQTVEAKRAMADGTLSVGAAVQPELSDALSGAADGKLALVATVNAISVLWGLTGIDGELLLSATADALAADAVVAEPVPGQIQLFAEADPLAADVILATGGGELAFYAALDGSAVAAVIGASTGVVSLDAAALCALADAVSAQASGAGQIQATVTAVARYPRFAQSGSTVRIYRPLRYKQEGGTVYIDYLQPWIDSEEDGDYLIIRQVYSATENGDYLEVE